MTNTYNNNNNNKEGTKYKFKIHLVGDRYEGCKTSFLNVVCNNSFNLEYTHTTIWDYMEKEMEINDIRISVAIYDYFFPNDGREYKANEHRANFEYLHGIVFLYSITNKESFENIKQFWYKEYIKKYKMIDKKYFKKPKLFKPTIMIIGNKSDLRNESNQSECVNSDDARSFASSIGALFFEISLRENSNVETAYTEMVKAILTNYEIAGGSSVSEISTN
ncbi:hypothetical protein DICPUDRAFT_78917 [Dictyostelium purpureum]|uniref:Uncharacterized protein n=1 Tax=Dictyostelium purpureum TaxID=5786 RepID=F0ZKZ9_DICPU|nr:uncharacterized protein DICPUDRAFT_78917 [Dictyostelium purpureum]EGC35352.1 hypothetical protein DICPUDRAFT_78917 [Dictyostelium purpureum]|eukprot:XP_003288090.1 hypothetical protein DICPUDRAFT_78917 [Dictyostelium purpureum]